MCVPDFIQVQRVITYSHVCFECVVTVGWKIGGVFVREASQETKCCYSTALMAPGCVCHQPSGLASLLRNHHPHHTHTHAHTKHANAHLEEADAQVVAAVAPRQIAQHILVIVLEHAQDEVARGDTVCALRCLEAAERLDLEGVGASGRVGCAVRRLCYEPYCS